MIPSFPKILQLGDRALSCLFDGPIEITEKIDGSQFSLGLLDGKLFARSKGQMVVEGDAWNIPKLFSNAAALLTRFQQHCKTIGLNDLLVSGEFLNQPKHNILTYGRVPAGNFAAFAVAERHLNAWTYFSPQRYVDFLKDIGVESVAVLYEGELKPSMDFFNDLLKKESALGGPSIEGFVIKNYSQSILLGGMHVPIACGKFVSEAFKEKHKREWDPGLSIVDQIIMQYAGSARWEKAVQHMREAGTLTDSPKDIGPLMKALNTDFHQEEKEEIKEILFKHFWKEISRGCSKGFPEWYKSRLLKSTVGDE